MRGVLHSLAGALAILALAPFAKANVATFAAPALDKWMYSNVPATVGGTRETSPVFGFPATAEDEDRLGQFMVAFQTSAQITPGLLASFYQVTRVTLSVFTSDSFTNTYDPTYDSFRTHLPASAPLFLPDADPGRPVEVYGVGLRGGFTSLSPTVAGAGPGQYHENSPFGAATPGGRNAFPIMFNTVGAPVDVSDNVTGLFEATPWAVAQIDGLTPGSLIPEGSEYRFTLDLSSAAIRAYIQNSLSIGMLGLMVTSLSPVPGQGSGVPYPTFLTKENQIGPEYAPKLQIEYTIIPEPNTATSILLGVTLLAVWRGWRRREWLS